MRITLAENAGYCPGVGKAVNLALETAANSGQNVFSLGPIIHNPQVIEFLGSRGVGVVNDLAELPAGSTLLVRSHGLPPEKLARARAMGLNVVDATCNFVRRAQKYAKQLHQDGYQVYIIGDQGHPEVIAIKAHTENNAVVIRGPDDIDKLELTTRQKIGVIAQTTQRWENVQDCINKLLRKVGELRIYPTICPASTRRQSETMKLATENQVILVVGGKNSANTSNLATISRAAGARTYHIEGPGEINPDWFRGVSAIGITAGASTPRWIIEGVLSRMEEIKEQQTENLDQPEASAPENMAEVAMEMTGPKLERGALINATVVKVEPDRVLVDVGYKTEGIIDVKDLTRFQIDDPNEVVAVGDEFNVVVIKTENEEGHPILSKKRADADLAWEEIQKAQSADGIITATVKEEVKGGLLVDLGVRGFVPASQASSQYVEDLSQFIGQTLKFKILEVDERRKNVVLSHKEVEIAEQEAAKQEVFASIKEGDVISGIVKRLTSFGAFVEIKPGVEGLLHVSEIAWERVNHPSDVLKEGEEIKVKILGIDQEKGRISLGRKQVLPDPWVTLQKEIKEGDVVTGTVTRLVDFGAFIRLAPGIEGLAHISELAYQHVDTPQDVLKSGEEVKVKVLNIDPEAKRISLSVKQAAPEPKKKESAPKKQAASVPTEPTTEGYTIGDMVGDIFGDALKK